MKGRLLYIVGPSGSGKDSLIRYARDHLPPAAAVNFARRTITRPAAAGGEDHIAVSPAEFEVLLASDAFSMHWRANGLAYGIGREIGDQLGRGRTVVVSGSREHLPQARETYPALEVIAVNASPDILRARLAKRAREDAQAIEARLQRALRFAVPGPIGAHEIFNDGELAVAGDQLVALIAPLSVGSVGSRP